MESKISASHDTLLQQAFSLHQVGKLAEAATQYEVLLNVFPKDSGLLSNLGTIALQLGNPQEAVRLLGLSLGINPNQPKILSNFGIGLQYLHRFDEALASLDFAIALEPEYAEAYNNRGNIFKDLGKLDQAFVNYEQAIALKPDYAEAYYNRASILHELKCFEDALSSFDRALALEPDYAEAYGNRGNVLKDMNRLEDAQASYDLAIALKPDYVSPYWNKALLKLLAGDFEEGWRLYEWRWKDTGKKHFRNFPQPLWQGEEVPVGKTLLIHAEQGLGDVIQFCRYIPLIAARGIEIVFEVPVSLMGLMGTLAGNFAVVEAGRPLPPFDLQCPIMSLPLAFGTTLSSIPADVPYLYADKHKQTAWRQRLGVKTKPRIGLVWSGSKAHGNDHNRSIPLALLEPLLQLPLEFHSLQKEVRVDDAAYLANRVLIQLHQEELNDFSDTAALIREMDLVIAVDTSVAHLAGALGQAVWMLLPFAPDFRWLLDRDDSPWYPSATLFRQPVVGGWSEVVSNVMQQLQA